MKLVRLFAILSISGSCGEGLGSGARKDRTALEDNSQNTAISTNSVDAASSLPTKKGKEGGRTGSASELDNEEGETAGPDCSEECAAEDPLQKEKTPSGPAPTLASITPNRGKSAGGTEIRLTGTEFLPDVEVIVGTKSCENIELISAREIKCVTPSHDVGMVDISVQNIDKKKASLKDAFDFYLPDVWRSVSTTNAPPASSQHAQVWTGSKMFVWGGGHHSRR